MVTLRLTFWGNFTLFCTAVTPFSPPTNRAQEFQFLHILNNTCYVESFFINSIVMKWYLILISFFCDCAGSLSLHEGFLQFWWAVETLCCSARASHCGGCSCGGARGTRLTDSGSMQAHGYEGSALAANSLRRCGALECFQFSSVPQSCWTLWDPMDCSTPGLPVHHQFLELTQANVHWVGDAIQPSPLTSPSPPALDLSQHQGLFQCVSSSHQVAKVLELQLQHQSLQWIIRFDLLYYFF